MEDPRKEKFLYNLAKIRDVSASMVRRLGDARIEVDTLDIQDSIDLVRDDIVGIRKMFVSRTSAQIGSPLKNDTVREELRQRFGELQSDAETLMEMIESGNRVDDATFVPLYDKVKNVAMALHLYTVARESIAPENRAFDTSAVSNEDYRAKLPMDLRRMVDIFTGGGVVKTPLKLKVSATAWADVGERCVDWCMATDGTVYALIEKKPRPPARTRTGAYIKKYSAHSAEGEVLTDTIRMQATRLFLVKDRYLIWYVDVRSKALLMGFDVTKTTARRTTGELDLANSYEMPPRWADESAQLFQYHAFQDIDHNTGEFSLFIHGQNKRSFGAFFRIITASFLDTSLGATSHFRMIKMPIPTELYTSGLPGLRDDLESMTIDFEDYSAHQNMISVRNMACNDHTIVIARSLWWGRNPATEIGRHYGIVIAWYDKKKVLAAADGDTVPARAARLISQHSFGVADGTAQENFSVNAMTIGPDDRVILVHPSMRIRTLGPKDSYAKISKYATTHQNVDDQYITKLRSNHNGVALALVVNRSAGAGKKSAALRELISADLPVLYTSKPSEHWAEKLQN